MTVTESRLASSSPRATALALPLCGKYGSKSKRVRTASPGAVRSFRSAAVLVPTHDARSSVADTSGRVEMGPTCRCHNESFRPTLPPFLPSPSPVFRRCGAPEKNPKAHQEEAAAAAEGVGLRGSSDEVINPGRDARSSLVSSPAGGYGGGRCTCFYRLLRSTRTAAGEERRGAAAETTGTRRWPSTPGRDARALHLP
jgi:hypothetical protein